MTDVNQETLESIMAGLDIEQLVAASGIGKKAEANKDIKEAFDFIAPHIRHAVELALEKGTLHEESTLKNLWELLAVAHRLHELMK